MNVDIVTDLGYGDSGKGVLTDNLCREDSLVIRYCGGQQAGHTVMRDGKKHVFSSFGSGTLKGRPSFFTEDTTMYLNSLINERNTLNSLGVEPTLYLHPLTKVTTPYDIFFNRITEKRNKHGSCGLGVAATMKRNIETGYKLYAVDFLNKNVLYQKLARIKEFFASKVIDEVILNLNTKNQIREVLQEQEQLFFDNIESGLPFEVATLDDIIGKFKHIVFEGAQGIMLDMDHGFFPNVTYANTTSKNALRYCDKYRFAPTINYVTRCYQTRHGNGYMSNNDPIALINNEEEINVLNEYQGEFRTGEIDYNQLQYALRVDQIYHNPQWFSKKNMIVTCVDQRPEFEFKINQFPDIDNLYLNDSPECGNLIKVYDKCPKRSRNTISLSYK